MGDYVRRATWLPIAYAPRDGTRILLSVHGERLCIGYWIQMQNDGLWNCDSEPGHPTHWQPLPAPPDSGEPRS